MNSSFSVPLVVANPVGQARVGEPLTAGLPVAVGGRAAGQARAELLAYADFVLGAWEEDLGIQDLRFSDGLLAACLRAPADHPGRESWFAKAAELWERGMSQVRSTYHYAKTHAILLENGHLYPCRVGRCC
ncbi:MAG: hypothetical protein FJY95_12555 [Candidatus Handelsmanbacteria bacterium]|nr:hypothetical protein [Candidatus Handelsmanbacteria bacterium]